MVQKRLVYMYLLNVPSVSSCYLNKIKQTSLLGKLPALTLEILKSFAFWTIWVKGLCLCITLVLVVYDTKQLIYTRVIQ